jgi:hypothetical protein
MLLRRIARPLLSAVFIGQGVETLRNPKVTLDAAQTAVTTLQTLPDPVGSKIPSDPETVARINAAVQVGCRGSPRRHWRSPSYPEVLADICSGTNPTRNGKPRSAATCSPI